ncbi:GNAT family N-acetyltransferase [Quadrisphaera sp. DSM 44207]|uniref:GNAT family N-acetyltransferase n=1 Tax=Quadrisphaera sp. DSM 44207 TaxID=1881057 RepID=UPI000888003F|nr:GNAT family N-acetyltransferase [Quadrisphaera sp. DSM 44207]SDQ75331.1 Ribosomal protein S18 acetylase RimI [Quadrisphaera sp. DSM 44207]
MGADAADGDEVVLGLGAEPSGLRTAEVRRVDVAAATPDDALALAELAARTFPLACPPGTDPAAVARHVAEELAPERFAAWARDRDRVLLLARREGAAGPAGYVLLVADPAPPAPVAGPAVLLSKAYVAADEQGSGLARVLVVAALGAARERFGARPVWLGTNRQNARAQAFYRRLGFEQVGSRTFVVGGQEHDDVVLLLADGAPAG